MTVVLQLFLLIAPCVAWSASGGSEAVARRRDVAEAFVVAGIGLLAAAATAIAIEADGLGAILGVLGASLLMFGGIYLRRTSQADPLLAGSGDGV